MNFFVVPLMLVYFACIWGTFSTMVDGQPDVCFHRRSCDGQNVNVKRIDCSANPLAIYKTYRGNFSMDDLTSGLRSIAITCDSGLLENVPNAIFYPAKCRYNCEGDSCPATCGVKYYPSGDDNAYCKNHNGKGRWRTFNFRCTEIVCPYSTLPEVVGGRFDPSDCTGNGTGSTCTMTCNVGNYATELKQTTCEKVSKKKGEWTEGRYLCRELTTTETATTN